VYDADGKRVKRNVGTPGETWMIYGFDGELVAEYAAPNGVNPKPSAPTTEYAYRAGEMLIQADASDCKWLVSDHLGSPRIILGTSGSLADVRRRDFMPFGEDLSAGQFGRTTAQGYEPSGTPSNPRENFATYERDDETGLDFAQARYYQSGLGRFTSVDPLAASGLAIKPQTWNRYAYCLNNPLKIVDPSGLEGEGDDDVILSVAIAEYASRATQTAYETLNGIASAFLEDNGLPTYDLPQNSFGRGVGHALALTQGTLELYGGATLAFGGGAEAVVTAPAAGTGVGAIIPAAGVATATVGAGVATHGGFVILNTASNLASGGTETNNESGSKTATQMAEDLSNKIGKNSVEAYTPSEKIRVDLKGKAHFDKPTNTKIPTPHVQTAKVNRGQNGQINTSKKETRSATKSDVRTARRIIEHRKKSS
jgi:RHS repeat-associated protein